MIKQGLQKYGFNIFAFTDPLMALEHFKLNIKDYNIVISDIRMPGMNGYEFVKKAKQFKKQVKVILVTAFEINDRGFYDTLRSVKIDMFVQKPLSINQLRQIIETSLD
jgi:CheY-like chemotaxis protein